MSVRKWILPALLLLLAGCAAPPVKIVPAPRKVVPLPTPEYRPETEKRFRDFVAALPRPGDTLSSLAERHLGDPSLGWRIAEFNGISSVRAGEPVVVPLWPEEPGGVSSSSYRTVPVIVYHKFSIRQADAMTVREEDFEAQMGWLKRNGYRVITLDALFDFLERRRAVPPRSVVITFDDGWRSVYDVAFPILKKYGYPATLFLYTDLAFPGAKTLDWGRLKEMADGGVDIQSHTKSHRSLSKIENGESFRQYFDSVRTELAESRRLIQARLGREVRYLAYPYGDTNSLVADTARKLGYRGALTVVRESNPFFADDFRVSRAMIYGSFSLKEFEENLDSSGDEGMR